jgi:hypothetical protein
MVSLRAREIKPAAILPGNDPGPAAPASMKSPHRAAKIMA